jgi:hypothetical protein
MIIFKRKIIYFFKSIWFEVSEFYLLTNAGTLLNAKKVCVGEEINLQICLFFEIIMLDVTNPSVLEIDQSDPIMFAVNKCNVSIIYQAYRVSMIGHSVAKRFISLAIEMKDEIIL